MRVRLRLCAALGALLLAACAANPFASPDVAPGTPRQEVIARLGPPTRVVPIAGGERLQYSLQPFGHYAWMVDLDASGRAVRSRQVLNEAEFNRIVPGQWTRADIEREFGPPGQVDAVSSWNGLVMTYRWRHADRSPMFYYVYLDRAGVVQRAHPGMEFVNAPNERR
jgi:ABC-type transport system substrate-binding protein